MAEVGVFAFKRREEGDHAEVENTGLRASRTQPQPHEPQD